MSNNLDDVRPNNVDYTFSGITFRELSEEDGKDKNYIVPIIRRSAIRSSAVLYSQWLETDKTDRIEKEMSKDHLSLPYLLFQFKEMKKNYPYTKSNSPESQQQFKNIENYLKTITDEKLFFAYGPVQVPFEKNAEIYIHKAVEARNKKERDLFRLGIVHNDTLIGCFVFDYIPETIFNNKAIGDIGIFIDPEYRDICKVNRTDDRSWRSILLGGVHLFEKFIPNSYRVGYYISATTHPLNSETRNLLEAYGFEYKVTKPSEYKQDRNYYLSKYNDFVHAIDTLSYAKVAATKFF